MAKTIDLVNDVIKVFSYTKTDLDEMFSDKADANHTHDNYYTKTEIDSKVTTINGSITDNVAALTTAINGKAASDHTHTGVYAPNSHNHTISDISDFSLHTHEDADVILNKNTANEKNLTQKLTEIDSAISSLQNADWDISIVTELPPEGTAGTLYFLHDANESASGDGNAFDEYIYDETNSRFEKVGQRTIDLTNYVTDVDISLSNAGILSISLTKDNTATAL